MRSSKYVSPCANDLQVVSALAQNLQHLYTTTTTPAIDNHELCEQLERIWPMLVHGPFLWHGRELKSSWLEQAGDFVSQLEDGELVSAEAVFACSNPLVAQYVRRFDNRLAAVDTRGHATLGAALAARHDAREKEENEGDTNCAS